MRRHKGHFADVAETYAREVVAGRIIVCRQIILSCQAFLDAIDSEEWVYNANLVERVCRFIQALPHVKGKWASRRELLKLEPFQVWMTAAIIGLVDHKGLRKHRQAFALIPRKNAKSTWAAALGLYMLVADNEAGAEVYIGANSEAQADACFMPARAMAMRAAGFDHFGVEVAARALFLADGSRLKPIIGKPGDGDSPHCAILDEAHENDTSDQYDTMLTGMGAREQPLLLTITTAGTNTAGPCRDLQLYAEQVLEGQVDDPRLFSAIYTIDPKDDWTDFNVWRKANPNLGVSVNEEYLLTQYNIAMARASKAPIARTKHLNQWVSSTSAYLNMAEWAKCANAPDLDSLKGKNLPAWIGIDLATKSDVSAVGMLVQHSGGLALYPFLFLPEGAIERSKNEAAYRQWADNEHLILCDGNATNFGDVETKVRELVQWFDVQSIGYDAWQGHNLGTNLASDGLNVFEYPQKHSVMHAPMDELEALLAENKLQHPNNPALNWMAGNLCAHYSGDFKKPTKPMKQDHLKIDGMVAALMALGLSMREREAEAEFYVAWG